MLTAQIINGLVSGAMYSLVAIGFTLILGVLDKLNFAHQEVFMVGGFAGIVLNPFVPMWWSYPLVFVVGGILGLITEFVAFRRFTSGDAKITAALSSLAVGLIIVDLVQRKWGGDPVPIGAGNSILGTRFRLFGVELLYIQVLMLGVAIVLMGGLHFLIHRTSMGRQIRAVAESSANATLNGINVRRITQTVFFVSSALAAITGLLLAQRTGYANSDIGLTFGLKALAIMAIGGMGDVRGAAVAGLVVGMLEALTFHFGLGRMADMTVWVAMFVVLIFRPKGIFSASTHDEQRV